MKASRRLALESLSLSRRQLLKGMAVAGSVSIGTHSSIVRADADTDRAFMAEAFRMKQLAVDRGDQPYGAVIVRGNEIIGRGVSAVVTDTDPTAHAEMVAIRDACRRLGSRDLSGCVMYGTSKACPMCETAAYWARVSSLVYGEAAVSAGAPGYPRCG